jgi:hypothetical protein
LAQSERQQADHLLHPHAFWQHGGLLGLSSAAWSEKRSTKLDEKSTSWWQHHLMQYSEKRHKMTQSNSCLLLFLTPMPLCIDRQEIEQKVKAALVIQQLQPHRSDSQFQHSLRSYTTYPKVTFKQHLRGNKNKL